MVWVIPALLTVGGVVMGYVQGLPWFYIYVGACVVFAFVCKGLLWFTDWRFRTTARYKLSFYDLKVSQILSDDGSVSEIKLGFILQSSATFPIQFEIQDLDTKLMDGLYPPKREYKKKRIIMDPDKKGWFSDHGIKLGGGDTNNKVIEGSIYARLLYGRPGNLKHELKFRKRVFIKFNDVGKVQLVDWHAV